LSRVLTKVLDERPNDVIDIFEDISKETKRSQFVSQVDTVQDKVDRSTEVALCQIQEKLFKVVTLILSIDRRRIVFVNKTEISIFHSFHVSRYQSIPSSRFVWLYTNEAFHHY